jgi:hypothetical protein
LNCSIAGNLNRYTGSLSVAKCITGCDIEFDKKNWVQVTVSNNHALIIRAIEQKDWRSCDKIYERTSYEDD